MVIDHEQFTALHNEARKHGNFETFRDEMLRLTESVWHHHRATATATTAEPVQEAAPEADPGDAQQEASPEKQAETGSETPPAPPEQPAQ